MSDTSPIVYLTVLIVLLGGTAFFVLRQLIKTRRTEMNFARLQKKLQKEKGTAKEYYELGSIFLDKKLYAQAITLFQKALKTGEEIEDENRALILNAIGFTYVAQEQYDLGIKNYKEALRLYPDYLIAWNNLGNVYEKKQLVSQAVEAYEESLKIDPKNSIAKRRADSLKKRITT